MPENISGLKKNRKQKAFLLTAPSKREKDAAQVA